MVVWKHQGWYQERHLLLHGSLAVDQGPSSLMNDWHGRFRGPWRPCHNEQSTWSTSCGTGSMPLHKSVRRLQGTVERHTGQRQVNKRTWKSLANAELTLTFSVPSFWRTFLSALTSYLNKSHCDRTPHQDICVHQGRRISFDGHSISKKSQPTPGCTNWYRLFHVTRKQTVLNCWLLSLISTFFLSFNLCISSNEAWSFVILFVVVVVVVVVVSCLLAIVCCTLEWSLWWAHFEQIPL